MISQSAALDLIYQPAVSSAQLQVQGHPPGFVSRATETGIKHADTMFDTVKQPLIEFVGPDKTTGQLLDRPVHGEIVLTGGDNQVDLFENSIVIDLVMMEEGTTRCLTDADTDVLIDPSTTADMVINKNLISQYFFNPFKAVKNFHQACIVIIKTVVDGFATTTKMAELPEFAISSRSPGKVADIQSRQRANPVHALLGPERGIVGKFEITPGFLSFLDKVKK